MTAPIPLRADLQTPPSSWRYLGLVIVPGLGSYSFNAVAVTLPTLRADLALPDALLEFVVAGYGIPFAGGLILGGRLGDRFGRHRLFTGGMALFLIGAIACVLAPGIEVLLAARIVQGVGAALATPQVLATIQATSTGRTRIRALSAYGTSAGVGSAAGQVLGGALASTTGGPVSGWRAVYAVAVLFACLALVLSRFAPRRPAQEDIEIDLSGALRLSAGILVIASALALGPPLGWPWPVLLALPLGAVLLVLLWTHQNRRERAGRTPLLPPSVLRLRGLRMGLLCTGLFFLGYSAVLFVIARAFDDGLGISPLGAGLTLLLFATAFTIVASLLTRIQRLLGDATLLWGVGIQVVALAGMTVTVLLVWSADLLWLLQAPLLLLGVGQALLFSPLTQIVVREVPVEAAGLSGGLFSTVQQLSLSLGVIAIGGVTLTEGWTGQAELAAGIVFDLLLAAIVLFLAFAIVRRGARDCIRR